MRYVKKQAEPKIFSDWKALNGEDWQPSYNVLQNPEKRALHSALLFEQFDTCCYCGRSISFEDSHIEHFEPQESREDLALVYENLYASCIRETAPGSPLHCGHAKGNNFEREFAIRPSDDNCERRFLYSSQDGAIYAADRDDASANYMVGLLKLDINFLRDRRSETLKNVFDTDFLKSVTSEELIMLAINFRESGDAGRIMSFGHVVSRYAEQLLGYPVP
jgi:uncharacterized protein (TIGR02646 family)